MHANASVARTTSFGWSVRDVCGFRATSVCDLLILIPACAGVMRQGVETSASPPLLHSASSASTHGKGKGKGKNKGKGKGKGKGSQGGAGANAVDSSSEQAAAAAARQDVFVVGSSMVELPPGPPDVPAAPTVAVKKKRFLKV